jgi:plasmid stabilization system protein ParE
VKYQVIVTPEAQAGIRESFAYIHERSPLNAARWLQALYGQIDTLERFPERCMFAREREYLDEDLRQLVFKSHRIVFTIERKERRLTFSTCVMPAGGLLVSPPGKIEEVCGGEATPP